MKVVRTLAIAVALVSTQAFAGEKMIKIGVLGDESGPYSDLGEPGSVMAAQMAADDYGGKVLGKPIEIVSADMQWTCGRRSLQSKRSRYCLSCPARPTRSPSLCERVNRGGVAGFLAGGRPFQSFCLLAIEDRLTVSVLTYRSKFLLKFCR